MIEIHTKYDKHNVKILFDREVFVLITFMETGVTLETEGRMLEQTIKSHYDKLEQFDRGMVT